MKVLVYRQDKLRHKHKLLGYDFINLEELRFRECPHLPDSYFKSLLTTVPSYPAAVFRRQLFTWTIRWSSIEETWKLSLHAPGEGYIDCRAENNLITGTEACNTG